MGNTERCKMEYKNSHFREEWSANDEFYYLFIFSYSFYFYLYNHAKLKFLLFQNSLPSTKDVFVSFM
jgi:hypothetical protein